MKVSITHIDTACILLEINGYKILTDPTLDDAGKLYHHGFGTMSRKTENPALNFNTLDNIDLILLSHHQHKDNFDNKGKAFALTVPKIISTKMASKDLPNVIGLDNWESYELDTTLVPGLKITATPAQHRPFWIPEFLSGKVIGFIIEFDGQENGVIYIAGDTVYFSGIDEVAKRFKIDIGIFNVGSVQFRYLTGFAQFTMDSRGLMRAVMKLNPNKVVPVHYKGWTHFKESETTLKRNIARDPEISNKTLFLVSGVSTSV